MSRIVRRRALYLAPLLVLAGILDVLNSFGVSWDDYAVLAALLVTSELGRRLVERAKEPDRQARVFEAFFAAEILIIVWASWWMSFTRWLGPTALLLELTFANIALPRRAAIRVTALGVALYVTLIWAETLGWIRINGSFGLPTVAGNTNAAVVASAAALILLSFGAFAQREFAEILRRQESAAKQQQQLELLGRMAASVAHDVNNVLTAVHLSAEVLADPESDRETVSASAADVRAATARGQALVRQLLDFASSGQAETGSADAASTVMRLAPMLRRLGDSRGDVEVTAPSTPLVVPLNQTRIEQIVTNLVVNALDAAQGRVRVQVDVAAWHDASTATDAVRINGEPATLRHAEPLAFSTGVRITVTDTGTGIPADVFPRVLEPFFTTKPEGRGTGLGLSTVHTIAQGAGGGVHLATTARTGTRVDVYLPQPPATPTR